MSVSERLLGWAQRWLSEERVLRGVFWSLILGVAVVGWQDYALLNEAANEPLPGETETREPVVMTPPRPSDQLRPYLPLTMPKRSPGAAPDLPGLGAPDPQALSEPMIFVRGPGGAASALGRIDIGTAPKLDAFLAAQGGEIKELHLHSPGGSVADALAMAQSLRSAGIAVRVDDDGYCASSCPLVLSGGVERSAGRSAWIGVHQIYAAEGPKGSAGGRLADGMQRGQMITAEVQDHLVQMGVDPALWILALRTPPDQLYVLTPEEVARYKLAQIDA
ncbi:MAG: hypothetical protein MRY63_05430 [Neomegalonema sp.]|nr:hypothetical protein [Neomegalonema sp.]